MRRTRLAHARRDARRAGIERRSGTKEYMRFERIHERRIGIGQDTVGPAAQQNPQTSSSTGMARTFGSSIVSAWMRTVNPTRPSVMTWSSTWIISSSCRMSWRFALSSRRRSVVRDCLYTHVTCTIRYERSESPIEVLSANGCPLRIHANMKSRCRGTDRNRA